MSNEVRDDIMQDMLNRSNSLGYTTEERTEATLIFAVLDIAEQLELLTEVIRQGPVTK